MELFVAKNGQQLGPFSETQVRQMLADGSATGADLAWHSGMGEWQPLQTVLGVPGAAATSLPAPLPTANAPYPAANPMGLPGQFPAPVGYAPGAGMTDPNLASLGDRFLGVLIDGVVALVCAIPGSILAFTGALAVGDRDSDGVGAFGTATGVLLSLIGSLIYYVIQGYFLSRTSQSIGKKIIGTRIVMTDGRPAPLNNSFILRTLLPGLAIAFLPKLPFVGVIFGLAAFVYAVTDICMVFRADRRTLHDQIAGTKVVRANTAPLLG